MWKSAAVGPSSAKMICDAQDDRVSMGAPGTWAEVYLLQGGAQTADPAPRKRRGPCAAAMEGCCRRARAAGRAKVGPKACGAQQKP